MRQWRNWWSWLMWSMFVICNAMFIKQRKIKHSTQILENIIQTILLLLTVCCEEWSAHFLLPSDAPELKSIHGVCPWHGIQMRFKRFCWFFIMYFCDQYLWNTGSYSKWLSIDPCVRFLVFDFKIARIMAIWSQFVNKFRF